MIIIEKKDLIPIGIKIFASLGLEVSSSFPLVLLPFICSLKLPQLKSL